MGVAVEADGGQLLERGQLVRHGAAEVVIVQVEVSELLQLAYSRRDGAEEVVSAQVEVGEPSEVQGNTATARQTLFDISMWVLRPFAH